MSSHCTPNEAVETTMWSSCGFSCEAMHAGPRQLPRNDWSSPCPGRCLPSSCLQLSALQHCCIALDAWSMLRASECKAHLKGSRKAPSTQQSAADVRELPLPDQSLGGVSQPVLAAKDGKIFNVKLLSKSQRSSVWAALAVLQASTRSGQPSCKARCEGCQHLRVY